MTSAIRLLTVVISYLSIASAVRFISLSRRRISEQNPITRFMYRYSSLTGIFL
nr:MAG TPA: hypothetical protein [Caudoviricetes sp.]